MAATPAYSGNQITTGLVDWIRGVETKYNVMVKHYGEQLTASKQELNKKKEEIKALFAEISGLQGQLLNSRANEQNMYHEMQKLRRENATLLAMMADRVNCDIAMENTTDVQACGEQTPEQMLDNLLESFETPSPQPAEDYMRYLQFSPQPDVDHMPTHESVPVPAYRQPIYDYAIHMSANNPFVTHWHYNEASP